jgi:hypothetical protein
MASISDLTSGVTDSKGNPALMEYSTVRAG